MLPRGDRVVERIRLTALGQLPDVVRQGSRMAGEQQTKTKTALEFFSAELHAS